MRKVTGLHWSCGCSVHPSVQAIITMLMSACRLQYIRGQCLGLLFVFIRQWNLFSHPKDVFFCWTVWPLVDVIQVPFWDKFDCWWPVLMQLECCSVLTQVGFFQKRPPQDAMAAHIVLSRGVASKFEETPGNQWFWPRVPLGVCVCVLDPNVVYQHILDPLSRWFHTQTLDGPNYLVWGRFYRMVLTLGTTGWGRRGGTGGVGQDRAGEGLCRVGPPKPAWHTSRSYIQVKSSSIIRSVTRTFL